jgi:TonB family protein
MTFLLRIFLALVLLAMVAPGVYASESVTRPATPLPGNPRASYPEEAREQKVEGVVKFKAFIDESGAVLKVDIVQVPKLEMGFEEIARATVMGWKFEPALHEGEPIPWIYNGELVFFGFFPYERARMYDRSSEEMWLEILRLLRELGISRDKIDPENGVLVTDKHGFGSRKDRRPLTPELKKGVRAQQFTLHVYVPRFVEPARVYVDSVVHTRDRIFYQTGLPEEWLFRKLEEQIAEKGYAIPETLAGRARLARRLLGEEGEDPCHREGDEAPIFAIGPRFTQPERVDASYYKPLFPESDRQAGEEATLIMMAVITGDGTVRDVKLLNAAGETGEFYSSAMAAATLWRYRPVFFDGCPIDSYFSLRVDYIFGR